MAGDFDKCLEIQMDDSDVSLISSSRENDGGYDIKTENTPSSFTCFFIHAYSKLKKHSPLNALFKHPLIGRSSAMLQ